MRLHEPPHFAQNVHKYKTKLDPAIQDAQVANQVADIGRKRVEHFWRDASQWTSSSRWAKHCHGVKYSTHK